MKAYLIDVEEGRHGTVEITDHDHLGQFYRLIGCRCIDITVRTIGGKQFNVVLDDEGLLVDRPIISAVDGRMKGMLAGNLVIMGIDPEDYDRETVYPAVVMEY